jgi:hypothetical protein
MIRTLYQLAITVTFAAAVLVLVAQIFMRYETAILSVMTP